MPPGLVIPQVQVLDCEVTLRTTQEGRQFPCGLKREPGGGWGGGTGQGRGLRAGPLFQVGPLMREEMSLG
jgi:hypothetical protein